MFSCSAFANADAASLDTRSKMKQRIHMDIILIEVTYVRANDAKNSD